MEDFQTAYATFHRIKTEKSLALDDIIRDLHKCVMDTKFEEQMKMFLIQRLSEIEFRLAQGINEKAQTASVVGAFIEIRTVRKWVSDWLINFVLLSLIINKIMTN